MPKSKYEQDRDANIHRIQDIFESLGIAMLNETVSSVLSKQKVGKRKTLELEKPESDNDYDPNSDIDNHSDSDDDYDDDLNTETTNTMPNPANSINTMPTPTSPRKLTRSSAVDNSPGQSSRQSNEINILSDHFDAANMPPRNVRKKTMGHGLERMIKRGNEMPIQVTKGKLRPDVPIQAAKLALEYGVALRDILPIYTSWKQYQNREGQEEVPKVLRKVASRLDVDVKNDGPSKEACNDIIKKAVKQQRYLLKKQYFDESLIREQLQKNGTSWLTIGVTQKLRSMLALSGCNCAINKHNRGKVRLHQRTGARSHIAHQYSLRSKYNNMEPDAIEFFGECMTSPRNGCSELASQIYEDMVAEKERELEEGEPQKSPTQIVADNLSQVSHSSTFLPNMGVIPVSKTARSTSATEARLPQIQAQQASLVANQATLQEKQSLLCQTQEEVKEMQTKFEETNALLRAVLNL
ncbi:hypothetical protein GQ55_6G071100 [Panicum hallii var. hallii]|uniref:Uncharacterized protein n=1 Tax=Panicum hallii var. hallii TaxID=1504633 RepID=A0A2T7D4U7_9POAL|nr:hypothetical protein GQ55_6G071100 [Panicum hallii var. hallii]